MSDPDASPPLAGLMLIDKDPGFTSMDVCAIVRSRFRRGGAPKRLKVGHAGTLDPLATGLLVVMVGRATRHCERYMAEEKEYLATIDLSRRSTTDDLGGEVTPAPASARPSDAAIAEGMRALTGRIQQAPPAYSAISVGGVRSYDLARRGLAVPLAARAVVVHEFELLASAWPLLDVRVRCGKGVYIRSLARDLGARLGLGGGMLTRLRRTRAGAFDVREASRLEALPEVLSAGCLRAIEPAAGPPALGGPPPPGPTDRPTW